MSSRAADPAVRSAVRTFPSDETPVPALPQAGEGARAAREQEVLKKFRIIFSSVKKHFSWVEKQCGLSGSQLWLLIELREQPGLRVSELARLLSVHLSTVSNLLDKLERTGFISRQRNADDQRVVRVYLTDKGEATVARAPAPARGVLPDALARVPLAALMALENDLDTLIGYFELSDDQAPLRPLSEL